jgi:hypothetical protein
MIYGPGQREVLGPSGLVARREVKYQQNMTCTTSEHMFGWFLQVSSHTIDAITPVKWLGSEKRKYEELTRISIAMSPE